MRKYKEEAVKEGGNKLTKISKRDARKLYDNGEEIYISNGGKNAWGYDKSLADGFDFDVASFDDIIHDIYNDDKNLVFLKKASQ